MMLSKLVMRALVFAIATLSHAVLVANLKSSALVPENVDRLAALLLAHSPVPSYITTNGRSIRASEVRMDDEAEAPRKKLKDALVWVDCEMTGLGGEGGPGQDTLLEVACLITDGDLNLIAEGPDIVIHHPDEVLAGMNDWCKMQFGWKGAGDVEPGLLADQVRKSSISLEQADRQLLEFVQKHVDQNVGVLAGNTVHMDKRFLDKFAPRFMNHLHYRLVDVSTMKELCRRWYPCEFEQAPEKKGSHRAMEDIQESLKELQFYRKAVCKVPIAKS